MTNESNGSKNGQDAEQKEPNGTKPPKEKEETISETRKPKQITITDIELEQIKKESFEYKDKYLRQLAEVENARKRMLKEKQDMIQFSTQNLIAEFLHPMDHLENALKFTKDMSDEVKHWAFGFEMILSQFKDVLTNNGVTSIESKGKIFDPHVHEAVEMVETTDYPPGTVIDEFIRGYKMGDRLVRAARVKVAKAPLAAAKENNKQEPNNK